MREVPGSEDGQQFLELFPGSLHMSDGGKLAATSSRPHVAEIAEVNNYLKLGCTDNHHLLRSTADGARSSQTAHTPKVGIRLEALQVRALLMGPVFAILTEYAAVSDAGGQTPQGNLPELSNLSRPVLKTMI